MNKLPWKKQLTTLNALYALQKGLLKGINQTEFGILAQMRLLPVDDPIKLAEIYHSFLKKYLLAVITEIEQLERDINDQNLDLNQKLQKIKILDNKKIEIVIVKEELNALEENYTFTTTVPIKN